MFPIIIYDQQKLFYLKKSTTDLVEKLKHRKKAQNTTKTITNWINSTNRSILIKSKVGVNAI